LLYGYARAEAIGQNEEQLLGTSVPGSSFAEVKAQIARDGRWTGVLHQKAKDGRTVIVESSLQLETMNGGRFVLEAIREVRPAAASKKSGK
jgi:two-component system CheB/CheR fusion protein